MAKDITKTINALRCVAVGRCRDRLEQAAEKARGILKNGQHTEQTEKPSSGEEQYGVTSLMKRRHNL